MSIKNFFKGVLRVLVISALLVCGFFLYLHYSDLKLENMNIGEIISQKLIKNEVQPEKGVIKRPIAVMIDNHRAARPQSGFGSADVVYEMLAEGNITRYMMVFYSKKPDVVGPIRSAREYFIDRAQEHSAVYIHAGGSSYALRDLKKYSLPEFDALRTPFGYRVYAGGRYSPHNLYAEFSSILKISEKSGYMASGGELFSDIFRYSNEPLADFTSIPKYREDKGFFKLVYRRATRFDFGYTVEYRYDRNNNNYYRYENGIVQRDGSTKKKVKPENIIVQIQPVLKVREKGLLQIQDTGTGKGYYFNSGKAVRITWKKENRFSPTRYFDEKGEKLTIAPGQIFIQVIPETKTMKL